MARMGDDYNMQGVLLKPERRLHGIGEKGDTTLIVCPDCGRELRPVNNAVGVWCPCGKIIDLKEVRE